MASPASCSRREIFTGWTGWLGGTTKSDTARFDDLTYTTGANGSQNIVVVTEIGTRQPSRPDATVRVVCGPLCFVAICVLIAALQ